MDSATSTSRLLFQLASEEDWSRLEESLLKLNENSNQVLQEPYGELAPEPVPPDSSLLHVVCSYWSVPLSIVESILGRAPQLATARDELGRNPLHISIVEGSCQPSIIRLLAQTAPEASRQRDDSYCTPVEVLAQKLLMQEERSKYAPRNHTESQSAISQQLESKLNRLWECVQVLAVASSNQRVDWGAPILHACLAAQGFPFALMERARKRYAHQFQQADSHGNYPLHILAGWDPEEDTEDYLWQVAKGYPEAAKTVNQEEELPLDVALHCGMRGWDTGIAQLLEVYPAPERFSMGESSHLLARAAGRTTLIFEMLRNQPQFFTYHRR